MKASELGAPLAPLPPAWAAVLPGWTPGRLAAVHAAVCLASGIPGRPRSLARVFELLAEARPGFVPPPRGRLDSWARTACSCSIPC